MEAKVIERECTAEKTRCYNCSKYGHVSKDCKLPKREKGACFNCGVKDHMISERKGKTESDSIAHVNTKRIDSDFYRIITLKINDLVGNFEMKVDALFDTGSPIPFVKEKFILKCFVKTDYSNKYCGINNSKLNVGTTVIDIICEKMNESRIPVYWRQHYVIFYDHWQRCDKET